MSNHPLTLVVRFGLELALLGVYGWWGWRTGQGWLAYALAAGLPLIVAVLWGAFCSPKAALDVPGAVRLAVEAALFLGGTWMLASGGATWAAAVFCGLWLIQTAATYDRVAALLRS